jgi:hypothetical protein
MLVTLIYFTGFVLTFIIITLYKVKTYKNAQYRRRLDDSEDVIVLSIFWPFSILVGIFYSIGLFLGFVYKLLVMILTKYL